MSRRSDAGRGALEDMQQARSAPARALADPAAELEQLLERVRRLRYDHNNPERFHAERSDIAGAMGGLLKRLRSSTAREHALSLTPVSPQLRDERASVAVRNAIRESRPILHLKGSHAPHDA